MQAILKNKHTQFCEWLEDVKRKQGVTDEGLDKMGDEVVHLYFTYLQKIGEAREIVESYERIQKAIRNRIKARQRGVIEKENIPIVSGIER